MKWYFIILGLLLIAFALLRCTKKELLIYPFKKANLLPDAKEFMELLNVYRKQHNLTELKVDDNASMMEFDHVLYMIDKGVSHDNLDERRSELALEGAENVMEVVSGYFSSVESIFNAFKNSPEHDKCLLSNKVNTCGISIKNDADGKKYCALILFKI